MFYDIVFDLIKIIRSLKASQNDCQILIFVKDIYLLGRRMCIFIATTRLGDSDFIWNTMLTLWKIGF